MKGNTIVLKVSVYLINEAIEKEDLNEWPMEENVSEQYHELLPLFNRGLADRHPPHCPGIDHEVWLRDGETPTWGSLYSMLRAELVVLQEWFEENLLKGSITQSSSPCVAPVRFTMEPHGAYHSVSIIEI